MGIVQLPENLDHLAGVIGAVDGERIEALVSAMQKEGLIELLTTVFASRWQLGTVSSNPTHSAK